MPAPDCALAPRRAEARGSDPTHGADSFDERTGTPGAAARLQALVAASGRVDLQALMRAGLGSLPLPGGGQTLQRWAVLAEVAAHDLSLAKLFEGHTDAQAILCELAGPTPPAGSTWGTWCAEPPSARLALQMRGASGAVLSGTKAWCSGAASVSHAVVSCWDADGRPCLAAVAMDQPGVRVTGDGWEAVGMADSGSFDVQFDAALATPIGQPGDYTARSGFWQGGAGIAACWLGGAVGIARAVRQALATSDDPYKLAHLGAIDTALVAARAVLRETAAWIDAHPRTNAQQAAMRARLAAEAACDTVMRHAGRALGAAPLCRDRNFARAMADLPVYVRQSHAERDQAASGRLAAAQEGWAL